MTTDSPTADLVLDALGHQTRRDILRLLKQGPMSVGSIAEQLPISRPAVSKHLRFLHEAGLVTYDPHGASNIFRLNADGFQKARLYLDLFWDDALAQFKQFAEAIDEADL